MRILLIEDSSDLASAMADALFEAGHDVAIHAGAGVEELLACLLSDPFDLVLLDLGLGDFDGAMLVHALALAADRPALIVSTGANEKRLGPLRCHVDAVLCKPFKVEELIGAVATVAAARDAPKSGVRPSPVPAKRRDTA